MHYDVIVIGSGPGGEGAAMSLAKNGKKVAVVEKYSMVGGNCAHKATIPSKALRHSVQKYEEYHRNPLFQKFDQPKFQDYLKTAEKIITKQIELRWTFYERNRIDVHFGAASFLSPHKILVKLNSGNPIYLEADYIIIATGSSPYHPPNLDFQNPRILDSNKILDLNYTPASCVIYGAGVVGTEYASIFSSMGIRVSLINQRNFLLSFLATEIVHALSYHLQAKGVRIYQKEEFDSLEINDDSVALVTKSSKKIKGEVLFWANGRNGNTTELGLENCELTSDHRNLLLVNSFYQTKVEHIYAVGDVIGYPSLASVAYDQGRISASHILNHKVEQRPEVIPTGIYTTPEISSIGKTEEELTTKNVPYETGHSWFRNLARAQITGQDIGMLKIIFHIKTLEVLGIHCFGDQASEIIHIGQVVMSQKGRHNNLMHFVNTTFNYPTMAEAYRVAALNGLNRI